MSPCLSPPGVKDDFRVYQSAGTNLSEKPQQIIAHVNPLVTLAIPTLNRTEFLRETLSSVLAQDYANLDILVSDNGSHDDTPSLAQTLIKGDPRARFRRNDVTVPSHEHFNQCLQAARGEFFILLCDDDCLSPGFVSELVGVAVRHAGANLVMPANVTIDEKGNLLKECAVPEAEVFDGAGFVCDFWLYWRPPQTLANLVTCLGRTEVLRRFGGYQGFARGQNIDNLLFLQCAISGRVGFARCAVFQWRVHGVSYGFTSTPQQIAESSRQFVRHLRRDPRTVEALAALPSARRKQIVNGARLMVVREFLTRAGFFDNPFRWAHIRRIFAFGPDTALWYVVLHHYYRRLRDLFSLGRARRVMAE